MIWVRQFRGPLILSRFLLWKMSSFISYIDKILFFCNSKIAHLICTCHLRIPCNVFVIQLTCMQMYHVLGTHKFNRFLFFCFLKKFPYWKVCTEMRHLVSSLPVSILTRDWGPFLSHCHPCHNKSFKSNTRGWVHYYRTLIFVNY